MGCTVRTSPSRVSFLRGVYLLGSLILVIVSAGLAASVAYAQPDGALARLKREDDNIQSTERLELKAQLSRAADVYSLLALGSGADVPHELLERAECIAVLPGVVKAAFLAGGQHGSGVVSCRDEKLGWTAPAFITMTAGSFGFQIGAQEVDVVLLMMAKNSRRSIASSKLTLGGDIAVAAGPVGRLAKGETDLDLSGIYSFARSRGVFAGVSLEGAVVRPNDRATSTYYGRQLMIEDILFKYAVTILPREAGRFISMLPRW
ncbi:MAG: lipid-binding SYLF domain-containing protein [Deltaproteobacteria bacterium]|nr:lipid-binding SYLF domain-containing protein [Deltaproteobacteria bacterium]